MLSFTVTRKIAKCEIKIAQMQNAIKWQTDLSIPDSSSSVLILESCLDMSDIRFDRFLKSRKIKSLKLSVKRGEGWAGVAGTIGGPKVAIKKSQIKSRKFSVNEGGCKRSCMGVDGKRTAKVANKVAKIE